MARRWVAAVVVVPMAAGCTGAGGGTARDAAPSAGSYTASVPVVQPGRPGEPATTLAPGETAQRPPTATANAADVRFVSMMVMHHTQALRMAKLASGRAADPGVQALARRISASQAPEISTLRAWLSAHGQQPAPGGSGGSGGHAGHGDMPGSVPPARIEALAQADGPAFDRLFLDLMAAHHAGAVQMAGEVTTAGTDQVVQEIAAELAAGQSAEIHRMEQLRADL